MNFRESHLNDGDLDPCRTTKDLHLDCSSMGSEVYSALPLPGFMRLGNTAPRAFECLAPKSRCIAAESQGQSFTSGCGPGYSGLMCLECTSQHYASGKQCKPCVSHGVFRGLFPTPTVAAVLLVLAIVALCLWRWMQLRAATREVSSGAETGVRQVLLEQLRAQAPLLLQMCDSARQCWLL